MSDNEVRLLGDRVLLREFVDTDEKVVHSYGSDPEVTRFMDWGPNSIEDTRTFLREAAGQAGRSSREGFDLAIVDIRSQAVIGSAALSVTNAEHRNLSRCLSPWGVRRRSLGRPVRLVWAG